MPASSSTRNVTSSVTAPTRPTATWTCTRWSRGGRKRRALLSFGNGVPPLTPPLGAHQDSQLRVPAIGEVGGRLEVVPAVLALLFAGRSALGYRVLREV